MKRWLSPLLAVIVLILLWELFARFSGIDTLLVAGPVDVAETLVDEADLLADATWLTAQEALLGLIAAIVLGVGLGLALHLSPFLRDAGLPVVVASQAVPTVVLAPLIVIALGFGIGTKVLIVAIACFFPIVIGTFDGLRSADPQLIQLLRSLGGGRWTVLRLAEVGSPGTELEFAL